MKDEERANKAGQQRSTGMHHTRNNEDREAAIQSGDERTTDTGESETEEAEGDETTKE